MPHHRTGDSIPTVAGALTAVNAPSIKQLAALVSSDPLPTRKAELIELVSARLKDDHFLRSVWARLDDIQRATVAEVVHGRSPRFEADRFLAKYGRDPDWGTLDDYARRSAGPTALRLFFFGGRTMPDDLRARLSAFVPPPALTVLASRDELPAAIEQRQTVWDPAAGTRREDAEEVSLAVRETERAAIHDLETVLRLVEAGKLAVSDKTRRPTASAMRLIGGALADGDFYPEGDDVGPIRAFAWPMLVQAAGLAELRGSRLGLTRAGVQALGADPAGVIRTAWHRWLGTKILDELGRVEAIRGQIGKGKRGLTAVASRRESIADALAECPHGRWVASDELFRYMRAVGHDFEVTRNAWTLYICEAGYGSLGYDGYGGWNILQARYALCLLFEYAATLGLIDVAYVPPAGARPDFHDLWGADELEYLSRYDGLAYLRLTALGAWCLGVAGTYRPPRIEAVPVFTVLANHEIAVTGSGLGHADRLVLERYAEQTSDRVWQLRRDRLLAAVERGESVAEVREFLTTRCATPIPASVLRLLDDVAERSECLVDRGPMRMIDCADPALVALLANDARTRSLCIAAGDHRLLVPVGGEPAFRRAVRKLGYAVRSDEQTRAVA